MSRRLQNKSASFQAAAEEDQYHHHQEQQPQRSQHDKQCHVSSNNDRNSNSSGSSIAERALCDSVPHVLLECADIPTLVALSGVCISLHNAVWEMEIPRRKQRFQDIILSTTSTTSSSSSLSFQDINSRKQIHQALQLRAEAERLIDGGVNLLPIPERGDDPHKYTAYACHRDPWFATERKQFLIRHSNQTHIIGMLPPVFYYPASTSTTKQFPNNNGGEVARMVHEQQQQEDEFMSQHELPTMLSSALEYLCQEAERFGWNDNRVWGYPHKVHRTWDSQQHHTLDMLHTMMEFAVRHDQMGAVRQWARRYLQHHPHALGVLHCALLLADAPEHYPPPITSRLRATAAERQRHRRNKKSLDVAFVCLVVVILARAAYLALSLA